MLFLIRWYKLPLADQKDVKDAFSALKDSAAELNESNDTLKHQVCLCFVSVVVSAD